MWWSASAVRSDRDAPNRPCAACLHVLKGPAKRGVVGGWRSPGVRDTAQRPGSQIPKLRHQAHARDDGPTQGPAWRDRSAGTTPEPISTTTYNASPHDPPDELTAVTDSGRDAGRQCRQCNFGCNLHADSAAFTRQQSSSDLSRPVEDCAECPALAGVRNRIRSGRSQSRLSRFTLQFRRQDQAQSRQPRRIRNQK